MSITKAGIYVVFDKVAGTYGEPFTSVNDATAIRRFNYLMANSKMVANDCQLYGIGWFNIESGSVDGFESPVFICNFEEEGEK